MELRKDVTMPSNPTYSPYTHLKSENIGYQTMGNIISETLNSVIIVTSSGRIVFVPKKP